MSQSGLTPPLHTWTATDIVQAIRHGHTTCAAVARACLDHIAVREPAVQAWQYLNAEQVMAQARALDQREPSGPLHGVPFGIKDIIDTYDMPTEYGSRPSTRDINRPVMQRVWPCHARLGAS